MSDVSPEDRKKAIEALKVGSEGCICPPHTATALAALLALGWRPAVAPTVDREAAERAIWEVLWPGTVDVMADAELRSERNQVRRIMNALAPLFLDRAQVAAEQREKDARLIDGLYPGTDGSALEKAWIGGCQAAAAVVRAGGEQNA